jgi:hypothetical protein
MSSAGYSAANHVGAGLAEPEVPHLALGDQLADHACHVLDRHVRIDAVLIQHVDMVGAEVAQTVLGTRRSRWAGRRPPEAV